jgi:hypothetical protein
MQRARALLRLLTDRFPPEPRHVHSLALGDDGRLLVRLNLPDGWLDVVLDEADLLLGTAELVLAIVDVVEARRPVNAVSPPPISEPRPR